MATPQPFDPKRYESLLAKEKELQGSLDSSVTGYAPGTAATPTDLATDAALRSVRQNIDRERAKKLQEQWYGKAKTEETFKGEGTQESLLSRGLNALSNPLYAISGVAEWAAGKGSKKDLIGNINANIKEREGFGNLLRRGGVPYGVSMPLGFALDVAFDPINWVTAGTTALIPRVGYGLAKGGIRGATLGATSRLIPLATKTANVLSLGRLGKATKVSRQLKEMGDDMVSYDPKTVLPFGIYAGKKISEIPDDYLAWMANVGKATGKLDERMKSLIETTWKPIARAEQHRRLLERSGTKIYQRVGETMEKIGNASMRATRGYEEAVGLPTITRGGGEIPSYLLRDSVVAKEPVRKVPGATAGYRIGDDQVLSIAEGVEQVLRSIPGGESIIKAFKYSPKEWFRLKKLEDEILKMENVTTIPQSSAIKDIINAGGEFQIPPSGSKGAVGATLDDGFEIATKAPDYASARSSDEMMQQLLGEKGIDASIEDIISARIKAEIAKDGTWYDNLVGDLKKNQRWGKWIDRTLDAYSSYIGAFKISKIGLTLSAWTNAVLGNLVMQQMAGVNIGSKKLFSTYQKVGSAILTGKSDDYIIKMILEDPAWVDFASNYPTVFTNVFGFGIDDLMRRKEIVSGALRGATEKIGALVKKGDLAGQGQADDALRAAIGVADTEGGRSALPTGLRKVEERLREQIKGVATTPSGKIEPISYAATELSDPNALQRLRFRIADRAKEPGAGLTTKVADIALNKAMQGYEKIDQVFRLSLALHLSKNGVSESELRTMSKMFGLVQDDILDVSKDALTGERIFMLSPEKATEVAQEVFLNYRAMPAAVKVLRTLPIFGAPFASFTYGMTTRAGKTALYSPSTMTKMNFLLSELSGDKTPLEKEALKSKYYSWYSDPGMLRLPFTDKYPLYVNLTNMIPYYSLNMFTPSERKYGQGVPDAVMSFLDKFPILQDPVGQVLFDYFIQPMLLKNGTVPQGAFGQALYPIDATPTTRALYAARQLGEAVVPGVAAFSAIPAAMTTDVESYAKYVPSYRWRQLALAMKGKTPLGIPSSESVSSRTGRAIGSNLGIQLQPLNTAYVEAETKKSLRDKINKLQ